MSMTKDELTYAIGQIEKQLMENERIYRKYQLKRIDQLDPDLVESVTRIGELSVALMIAKSDIAKKLREEYGIFII